MRELGMVIPEREEEFEKCWRALGICFWYIYKGYDPENPYDLSTSPEKFKIVARLEKA